MHRRVALVTGVGRRAGIAHGIACELAGAGWDIAFNYWRPYEQRVPNGSDPQNDPTAIAKELRKLGREVVAIEADLSDPATPASLMDAVGRELGPVTTLVLSHSESVDSGLLDTSLESFDRHFAVNVRASWQLITSFANQVPEQGGSIVALTSDHVVGNVPYGASKGALDRIVIAAARELAHLGITANLVNPGPVDTGWMNEGTRAWLTERQPTGRLGTPNDIAHLIAFLVSEKGRWVSGDLIHSDGGFSV